MATSSGTSVVGAQLVISGVDTQDDSFSIAIDGMASTPPSRVGYFYLVRYTLSGGVNARVNMAGPVFRPGVRFLRPSQNFTSTARFQLWVDWNFEGLSWAVSTTAP